MFKMIFLLCSGLFLALLIGGRDHGQQRFGLIEQQPPPALTEQMTEATTPVVTEAAFVPNAPVMVLPAVAEPANAAPVPAPITETGRVLLVNAKSANVRDGPGKDFPVISHLTRGESVLVVSEGEGQDGWSLIRIEGDGIEGYIATRLLSE